MSLSSLAALNAFSDAVQIWNILPAYLYEYNLGLEELSSTNASHFVSGYILKITSLKCLQLA